MKRLLVTGASGYIGRTTVQFAVGRWQVLGTYHANVVAHAGVASARLDILSEQQVTSLLLEYRPHVVIHTAYSQDDLRVISDGTRNVVKACELVGARLLHLSTDAVFDGERGWYRETDDPAPIHPYGKAKVESERAVAGSELRLRASTPSAHGPIGACFARDRDALIVRTSLVWGLDPLDVGTIRIKQTLDEGGRPALFTDEYRCPVRVDELASALLELAAGEVHGIIHVAGPARLSRYDFGVLLCERLGLDSRRIVPGLSRESGMIRPRDCSLDTSRARAILRTRISSPYELLGAIPGDLKPRPS